jgi:hypothetical protein
MAAGRAACRPQHRARNPNEITSPFPLDRVFAYYQFIEFCVVPVVALLGWLPVPHVGVEAVPPAPGRGQGR